MSEFTFGSLFTGIGGLDLGLERAGMTCKWQCEIDDYATRVLERHWPNVRRWRDVYDFIADANIQAKPTRTVDDDARQVMPNTESCYADRVDLICGGFPCQPISVAGRRKGMADNRWLWGAFAECVRILRPRWVLVENVPGLLSTPNSDGRRGGCFGVVLRDLAQLGYDAEWQVLPAAAFGAPHLRRRVFIVANSQSYGRQQRRAKPERQQGGHDASQRSAAYADAAGAGFQEWDGIQPRGQETVAATATFEWRTVEPTVCRSNPRIPNRVDRLKCLGNAVVPQVAEWIGERILEDVDG